MDYLTDSRDIRDAIARYCQRPILWIDTEIADFRSKTPKLSLIQVLDDSTDFKGDRASVFDVLECPECAIEFIERIAVNPAIEKVFHNAKYDLKFLGDKNAQNITCTLELAKKIPYYLAPVPNHTLKTLAEHLCKFPNVDKSEQSSDWGKRPLTPQKLHYARMDVVYLAQVHLRLLQLQQMAQTDPATEDINALILRYRRIEQQWKCLDSEMSHLKERLKVAMHQQQVPEQGGFKVSTHTKITKKVAFGELAQLAQTLDLDLDLSITLNKSLQKELGDVMEKLAIEEQVSTISQLKVAPQQDDDVPF
ncbi:ribonuclease D [Lusitaniella coriacea]|uniref:ribonuclease D n=1 Tax=Lusitaniella coriacea TaxID=1983105 RepID=UPI003CE8C909